MKKYFIIVIMFSAVFVSQIAAQDLNGILSEMAAQKDNSLHSMCNKADKSKFYVLDIFAMVMGQVTTTEVSILAKGKKVCFMGVATGKSEATNSTTASFEGGRVSCYQTADGERLRAAKLKRTGYKVVGEFAGVSGKTVKLNNCAIESP